MKTSFLKMSGIKNRNNTGRIKALTGIDSFNTLEMSRNVQSKNPLNLEYA